MTIEQSDKIDGMGLDAHKGEVVLMISDHLEWLDNRGHFLKLEEKLSSYINFAQSGQLQEIIPNSKGLGTRIKLVHQFDPPAKSRVILEAIKQQLSELNLEFSYEALPSKY
jgi:hypothetical protein